MRHYEENFKEAIAPMDSNVYNMIKMLFRKGIPELEGTPARTATSRRDHALFGVRNIPDLPRDEDVVTEEDLSIYVAALQRNGFFGPSSWYMNHDANALYAETDQNDGHLNMPVLFLAAQYDYVCECTHSQLATPMRTYCRNLTEQSIRSGHWLAQERPIEVNAAIVKWLAIEVPEAWPRQWNRNG